MGFPRGEMDSDLMEGAGNPEIRAFNLQNGCGGLAGWRDVDHFDKLTLDRFFYQTVGWRAQPRGNPRIKGGGGLGRYQARNGVSDFIKGPSCSAILKDPASGRILFGNFGVFQFAK